MMTQPVARDRLTDLLTTASGQWADNDLSSYRHTGARMFRRDGLPSAKNEAWRYTSLDFLNRHAFEPATADAGRALKTGDMQSLLLPESDAVRLVFVDGRYADHLSEAGRLPEGVTLGSLRDGMTRHPTAVKRHLDHTLAWGDTFAQLNTALMPEGVWLDIAPATRVAGAIELLHLSTGGRAPRIAHPHHLIVLGEGAQAMLLERHVTLDEGVCFNNALMGIELGKGAELEHERLQEEGPSSHHLTTIEVYQAGDSRYGHRSVLIGSAWSRTHIRVRLAGPRAEVDVDGLYMAGDGQLNDVHLDVRHEVPDCSSRERFKGLLDGRGRAVFDGRIVVAEEAQRTDASLSNDNLMLSREAEVDTKPQLEIHADDVRCSHGTTVGQLDEQMLFYLRSRGIGADEARRMLCLGFAGEVLDRFSHAALCTRASGRLAARLAVAEASTPKEYG